MMHFLIRFTSLLLQEAPPVARMLPESLADTAYSPRKLYIFDCLMAWATQSSERRFAVQKFAQARGMGVPNKVTLFA